MREKASSESGRETAPEAEVGRSSVGKEQSQISPPAETERETEGDDKTLRQQTEGETSTPVTPRQRKAKT